VDARYIAQRTEAELDASWKGAIVLPLANYNFVELMEEVRGRDAGINLPIRWFSRLSRCRLHQLELHKE